MRPFFFANHFLEYAFSQRCFPKCRQIPDVAGKAVCQKSITARQSASDAILQSLLHGYKPVFKEHPLGLEVESYLILSPSQQICYYNRKIFGGYLTFLMDRILADSCKPAFTAYLNTCFERPIPPTAPILLRAWPEKVEGRKVYLRGTMQIPGESGESGEWVDAIKVEALFIKPKAE